MSSTSLTNIADELAALAAKLRDNTLKIKSGSQGVGSGVIWQTDGLIITNAHVATSKRATVELADGRVFDNEALPLQIWRGRESYPRLGEPEGSAICGLCRLAKWQNCGGVEMIRLMVVAISPVVRAGLAAVVTSNSQLTVVGSVSDLDVFTREVGQLQPDVVLLDLGANLQPAIWEKLLLIQQQQYPVAFLVIVEELESIDLEAAIHSGVRGLLPSISTESEIVATTMAIADGLVVLHPDVLELLPMRQKIVTSPVQTLTPREVEVLGMLGSGLSNKAIAKHLHISEHTVKFHISSIFQKLGVSSRTEAVTVGVRLGLIML